MNFDFAEDENGIPFLNVKLTDYSLLSHPILNKGMAFSFAEREAFGLYGLIPPLVTNLEVQLTRSYETFVTKTTDIEKYIYLRDLQDSNETLYYKLVTNHIEEVMPIIYTPTVGLGCQKYSHIYRRPRGLYISYPDRFNIDKILSNHRFDRVSVIVVSDGERILGLGDQGAGGMGIPIGKLALYTACAGIPPFATLPILLDSGTNNPDRLDDPLYIGWHNERIRGAEYDEFIDLFVTAIKKRFPHVLLQWEDFAQQNANPILHRYRDQLCTFNDDIQGTAAIAVGSLLAAIIKAGTSLRDQRIVVVGAGSAGCGISSLILKTMIYDGIPEEDAKKCFYLIDKSGLLLDDMPDVFDFQLPFVRSRTEFSTWSHAEGQSYTLQDVVANIHPTVLIGVSGQPNIFDETLVRNMAKFVTRPIIFPLSNPTSRSEAQPDDLLRWTDGRAIVGTGSPFAPVNINGKWMTITQTNNSYIFPGLGLGLIAVKATRVTDEMFMAAAKVLADCSPAKSNPADNLLPPLTELREVSFKVAIAVAEVAFTAGLAKITRPDSIQEFIHQLIWDPEYLPYRHVDTL